MPGLSMPVTVVMARRSAHGRAPELRAWAEALCTAASRFPGHLGHRIHEVTDQGGSTGLVIGLSFSTSGDLVRWEQSDERAAALDAGRELTQGPPLPLPLEAMATQIWGHRDPVTPTSSKWRAAAIVWIGLFPPAVVANMLLEPLTGGWPAVLRTLVLTIVLVPVVVLGTVPLLNHVLLGRRTRRTSSQQYPGHPDQHETGAPERARTQRLDVAEDHEAHRDHDYRES